MGLRAARSCAAAPVRACVPASVRSPPPSLLPPAAPFPPPLRHRGVICLARSSAHRGGQDRQAAEAVRHRLSCAPTRRHENADTSTRRAQEEQTQRGEEAHKGRASADRAKHAQRGAEQPRGLERTDTRSKHRGDSGANTAGTTRGKERPRRAQRTRDATDREMRQSGDAQRTRQAH